MLYWKLLGERVLKTFFQALAAVLLAGGTLEPLSAPWRGALDTAGMAALLAVLTSLATVRLHLATQLDVIFRSLLTGIQTLGTLLAASGLGLVHAPWQPSLWASLGAAVASLITSLASMQVGEPGTPSLVKATL